MDSRKVTINWGLVVISTVVALVASEVSISMFYPQDLSVWYETEDGMTMHRPKIARYSPKFGHEIEINSLGMRDREHGVRKEKGIFRIMLLGDSFLEAFQVRYEDSFTSIVERKLGKQFGCPIEVLNAGVSGWGTDDQLTYLKRYGLSLTPDMVVVVMTLHNDVMDNLREKFHMVREGRLVEKPFRRTGWAQYKVLELKGWLAARLHLYQLFLRYWRSERVRGEAQLLDNHVVNLFKERPIDGVKEGWEITGLLLKEMKVTIDRSGGKMAIVLVPLSLQLYENEFAGLVMRHRLDREEIMVDGPQKRMMRWGTQEGVQVIDLLPAFKVAAARNQGRLYLRGDGHWNEDGHRLAAEVVAKELQSRGQFRCVDTSLSR